MAGKHKPFGQWLREKRVAKGFSLRKFAEEVGVSPTYLSHVEQGEADPPTAERVKKMASLLDENADEMIALAGRVPEDLPEIIQSHPSRIPELLREMDGLTDEQLLVVVNYVRGLKKRKGNGSARHLTLKESIATPSR
jgi:transcriptional regulator with XRE-family HTH domain